MLYDVFCYLWILSDDSDVNVEGWQQMSSSSNGFVIYPFSVANAGFQLAGTDIPDDELGFFQLFFTDTLLHDMVYQTNVVGDVRNARKRRGWPSTQDKAERLNWKPHFVGQADKNHAKDCVVCSNRHRQGERKRTIYYCDTCSTHPGLHPTECFRRYHTLVNYKNE